MKQQKDTNAFQTLSVLINKWREGTLYEVFDDWKWILSYSKKYKGAILYYTILGIVSSSLTIVSSVVSGFLINIIVGKKVEYFFHMLVIMVISSLLSLLINSFLSRISTKLSIKINNDIQADIFDKIIDADWLAINKYPHGDVLNRFNGDVTTVSSNAIQWIPTIIITIFNFISSFFVIFYFNKVMAAMAFLSAPFMLAASKIVLKKQREYNKKVREVNSKMMTFEVETFYNFDTIKSFGITHQYGHKMREWQEKLKDISLKYNVFQIKTNIYLSLSGLFVQLVVFSYCLWLLGTGQIQYGTMQIFMTRRSALESSFNSVVSLIPSLLTSSVSAHRIKELVDLPKEVYLPESHELDDGFDKGYSIIMNDVDYAYLENNKVITNSNFEAHPGEIIALVGPSGEGKTTMIRLILGLIHPDSGNVKIYTQDHRSVEANAEVRHLFAYVPQGNTILQGTIAENMRMVKQDASDEEIIEALKLACAWDFIKKLPDTIYTNMGERGRGFSEGQAQRIAIARALLKDAPILLLDEATSALDVTTERQVLKNIIQQRPNKTCIVTTHRPSVLNMCQRVYRVMKTHVTELSEEESSRMAMDF